MDEEQEVYVAKPMTLRDMLETNRSMTVSVVNEVNETLVMLDEIQYYVNNPTRVLRDELLDREVLSYSAEAGELVIKVKGEEDAE